MYFFFSRKLGNCGHLIRGQSFITFGHKGGGEVHQKQICKQED